MLLVLFLDSSDGSDGNLEKDYVDGFLRKNAASPFGEFSLKKGG